MKKTLTIDNQEVGFDFNMSTFIVFKSQTGVDMLPILTQLVSEVLKGTEDLFQEGKDITSYDIGTVLENVYSVEMIDLLNFVWSMAKTNDPQIQEPVKWFSQFEKFELIDVLQELLEIVLPSMLSTKKLESLKKMFQARTTK